VPSVVHAKELRTMRKLILKLNLSIDGFVAGPNGENDWIFLHAGPDSKAWAARMITDAGVHIMGSRSYAGWAGYWSASTDALFAAPMNEIPKVVFSRSGTTPALTEAMRGVPRTNAGASWAQARVASGNLREEIERLKSEPGKPILAHGGATFARSLVASGLIDEYRLAVHPVALGKGLSLFSDLPKPLSLQVAETTTFASGVTTKILRPAG
jgi:dihydrofolate reductase